MKRIAMGLAALLAAVTMTACNGMGGPGSATESSGWDLGEMPAVDVSVPDVNVSVPDVQVQVEKPDISFPDMSVPDINDAGIDVKTGKVSTGNADAQITDESGDFVYEGKLQQVGDDENGYIQVPLGYLPFQDEDVEGLLQYSDATGSNIVTLDYYKGTDYQTGANNLHAYLESQENVEGLTGAQVSPAGYKALQVYGHYTDGYFLVAWMIEDPADPTSSYYMAMEFDNAHSYLMACSSTFRTVEDYHKEND